MAVLYLHPETVEKLKDQMDAENSSRHDTEVHAKKIHEVKGMNDFNTMVADAISLEGYEVDKSKAAATIHVVRGPLMIPPWPAGTIRSYTVYGGLLEQADNKQPKYHQGITYLCLGSSPQPAIKPVGPTTPVIIVTTHKVCPRKEKEGGESLYKLKNVTRTRGDQQLAAVRLARAKEKGAVRMRLAQGTE